MRRDYKFEKKIVIASVIFSVVVTFFALVQFNNALHKMEYDKIYNRTKRAYNTFEYLNDQVEKGKLSKKEAQKKALDILEHYKFSDDSAYVWIGDYNMNVIMHPHISKGANIKDITSEFDKDAFEDLMRKAMKSDENSAKVVKHKWKKQSFKNKKDKIYTKRSVALKFEPWGWVIGTGTYSDATEKIFGKFIWYIFATYLIFFVFVISILSYLKNRSVEKLIEAIQFVAWFKNTKGEYTCVNKHLVKISPYSSAKELIGKHYFEDASEDLLNLIRIEDEYVLNTGQMVYAEREICLNGENCVVQVFKVPIYDFAGKVVGIAGMHRDITEEKKVEKIQKEFISIVSHELRTPLTSIIGSIQLILSLFKTEVSDRVKNLLNMTDKNSQRLKKLVDDILDASKLESGKLTFNMSDVNVVPLLKETIKEIEPYALQYKVKIKLKSNKYDEVYAHVDRERLKQVLANLLSNAIKFSKKNSKVDAELIVTNSELKIYIINYKSQIPTEKLDILFKKFSQVDATDARSYGGTGLGLYITKQLVENMDGEINVTSDEERTLFSVTFNLLRCDFNSK